MFIMKGWDRWLNWLNHQTALLARIPIVNWSAVVECCWQHSRMLFMLLIQSEMASFCRKSYTNNISSFGKKRVLLPHFGGQRCTYMLISSYFIPVVYRLSYISYIIIDIPRCIPQTFWQFAPTNRCFRWAPGWKSCRAAWSWRMLRR